MTNKKLKNFLIPAYTGLGNFILMTPFVRQLRVLFPDSCIDLLCGNRCGTEHVLRDSGLINRTLFLSEDSPFYEKARFFIGFRGHYDAVFFPFTVMMRDVAIVSILAGIHRRIGHTGTVPAVYELFFTDRVPFLPNRHETDLYLDLLEPLASGRVERRYEQTMGKAAKLTPTIEGELERYLQGKPFIALQVVAANGAATPKVWPGEHWRDLIGRFIDEGHRLVVLGDGPERLESERILAGYDKNVLNLVGRTTVPEAALIVSLSHGVICPDSGLMHVADALGVPLLALYGPTDFSRTRPIRENSHVMRLDMDCMPCLAKQRWSEAEAILKCPSRLACMRGLTPDRVFIEAERLFFSGQ
jgi:ADP-heptose:LPS heptosyltransferase